MQSSAANKPKANEKKQKIQVKQKILLEKKKLNFILIQNGKILVLCFCLQSKLQLFQEYRALFENFFGQSFKKTLLFSSPTTAKNFLQCCKAGKKPFTQADRALEIKRCCKHGR